MTEIDPKAYEKSWIDAQSILLREWRNLSDKERRKLVRHHRGLADLLEQLQNEWDDFSDAVTLAARNIVEGEDHSAKEHVCCVLVRTLDEITEEYVNLWWALPEADGIRFGDGSTSFIKELSENRAMLIREWPSRSIVETRNVPIGHPWLENTTEFTLANQGQPSWTEEDQKIVEEEGIGIVAAGAEINPAYEAEWSGA